MKLVRYALTVVSILALVAGYAASQLAYFQGNPADYALRVDQPTVGYAATGLLALCVILTLIREREAESDERW